MNKSELMQRVISLAERGCATTQPNPRVGCVIVKDGEIVGEGYHHSAGELHAERVALAQAGENARGSTVFVNLEPCSHQGRTPPCTDGLIDAGVAKVVAAMTDPNPLVSGAGFELLNNAGIEVESGLLCDEAVWLNRGFVSRMVRKRPWVRLKSAATLDGRTAAFDGKSKWITGPDARNEVQSLRSKCSAIITGIGTVLADDPQMNVRTESADTRQPYRVLLDTQLQLPSDSKIFGNDGNLIVFTLSSDKEKISAIVEQGAEVIAMDDSGTGKIDLNLVLSELAKWQCNEVLVEAGQELSGAFLQSGLVDELTLFYAGSLLGDQGKSMFKFNEAIEFESRAEFTVSSVNMIGEDVRVDAFNSESLRAIRGGQAQG